MKGLTKEQYDKEERSQTIHRTFNTLLSLCVLILGYFFIQDAVRPLYEDLSGITEQKAMKEEIHQIYLDENIRLCQYKDSLGNATIGVGHLVLKSDNLPKCITPHKALEILVKDYKYAKESVEKRYPWAEGEVKLILINLSFQLGERRLSKFQKTLQYLESEQYQLAAGELLDSVIFKQAPNRMVRHSARILSLSKLD